MEQSKITAILDQLGIKYENTVSHKGWMPVLCPFPYHNDTHFGSASINIKNGVVSCFVCDESKHISKVVQELLNISYKEAVEFIGEEKELDSIDLINTQENPVIDQPKTTNRTTLLHPFSYIDIMPTEQIYTKIRGWDVNWCKTYKVVKALSGKYTDYAIIPVKDKSLNLDSFEARKIMEYEYLCKFYSCSEDDYSLDKFKELKSKFSQGVIENNLKYKKGKVVQGDYEIINPTLLYLMQPKTFYPYNSFVYETLFDIDNLDKSKPLHICEGLATVPILKSVFNNSSCLFGAKLNDNQIKYLKEFPQVVIIPDVKEIDGCFIPDDASIQLIIKLNSFLKDVQIHPVESEDTDGDKFIEDLKKDIVPASKYLIQVMNLI